MNSHISVTDYPVHFMFVSRLEFLGSADQMALFPVRLNPRRRLGASLENSNGHISATGHPIHFMFHFYGGVFGVGRWNCAVASWTKYNVRKQCARSN